tara:strand:- start:363 stop:926 length:564 start_codon:yes stop_codon:yes gene_type:complete
MANSAKSPPSRKHKNGKPNVSQAIRDYIEGHPDCTAKQIQTHLNRKKLKCSPSLIDQQIRKANGGPKKPKKQAAPEKSKAEHIRDWYRENPDGAPKECIKALAKQGVEVQGFNVSQAKRNMPDGKPAKSTRGPGKGKRSYQAILAAKKFADDLGSIDKARAAVEYLDQMGGVGEARAALETLQELQS